jgi:predicted DNA-binding transcriptional regulator YafY
VAPEVLRSILWAIRDRKVIEASYVSFQRPEVTRRRLTPHALVFDGFRWHARAHDAADGGFKDFLLSRLSKPAISGEAIVSAEADAAWQSWHTLPIVPHPGLSEHQKRVVMQDYGMAGGKLDLVVREAVIFYVKRRLGLVDGHEQRPSNEQHIVLQSGNTRS